MTGIHPFWASNQVLVLGTKVKEPASQVVSQPGLRVTSLVPQQPVPSMLLAPGARPFVMLCHPLPQGQDGPDQVAENNWGSLWGRP